jgi:protocatechuate 3,4-dioxygenase beta subunit
MNGPISGKRAGLLVVALGSALAGAATGDEASKGTGTVVGRVVDLEGRPVAGAEVWAGDRDQVAARVRTDADGRFRLGLKSEERATVLWAEDQGRGLAREHLEDVRIFTGRETDLGDLALAPGGRLSGRVVDQEGRPVPGAEATIRSWHHVLGHTITPNGPNWTARGDEQGHVRTPALPAGRTELIVTAPGRARRSLDRLVAPGEAAVDLGDIRLDDERPVTGVVVDQDGRPVAGAKVVVDADYDHPATTGADGRFAVRDAAIDASWVHVDAPCYFDPAPRPFHELKDQRTDLRMALQKAYTIEGSVVDAETGKPVDFQHAQLCIVRRDKDGTFSLSG